MLPCLCQAYYFLHAHPSKRTSCGDCPEAYAADLFGVELYDIEEENSVVIANTTPREKEEP